MTEAHVNQLHGKNADPSLIHPIPLIGIIVGILILRAEGAYYSWVYIWVLPPFSHSWIIIIIWLYIALNRTPNIDCYWGGAVPKSALLTVAHGVKVLSRNYFGSLQVKKEKEDHYGHLGYGNFDLP